MHGAKRKRLLSTIDNIVCASAQIAFLLASFVSGTLPVFACLVSQTEHRDMKLSVFTVFDRHIATPLYGDHSDP
ncbi:hypothetical protein D1872_344340 [compost metagenome]